MAGDKGKNLKQPAGEKLSPWRKFTALTAIATSALAACGSPGSNEASPTSSPVETTASASQQPTHTLEATPLRTPSQNSLTQDADPTARSKNYDGSLERDERRDFTVDFNALHKAYESYKSGDGSWEDVVQLATPIFENYAETYTANPNFMPYDINYAEPQANVSMHANGPGQKGNPSTPEAQMAYNAYVADETVDAISFSNVYDQDGQLLDDEQKNKLVEYMLRVAWDQPGGSSTDSTNFQQRLLVLRDREETLRVSSVPILTSDLYKKAHIESSLDTSGADHLETIIASDGEAHYGGWATFVTGTGDAIRVEFVHSNNKKKDGGASGRYGPGPSVVPTRIEYCPAGYCDANSAFPSGTDQKLEEWNKTKPTK